MKPKNKYQRKILELSQGLSPLTEYQRKRAIAKAAPHIAKYNSKKQYVCLDCGHSWTGEEKKSVVCPHCSAKLEVDKGRKWNYCDKCYVAVVAKCKGFQVIRMFYMETNLRRGQAADYWFGEAYQRWLDPNGNCTIIGRTRHYLAYYCDLWNWSSDLEIRQEHYAHCVDPWKIVGHSSIIPEIKRNGYAGDFHDCSPYDLFHKLLTDNKVETMWKLGRYELVAYYLKKSYMVGKYWPSVKIALRHNYEIKQPDMWFDLLSFLESLHKDLRNPKLICPADLKAAHDEWLTKKRVHDEKVERENQRRRALTEEQRYLEDLKRVAADEEAYSKDKSMFFNLEFQDKEITVKPLVSVKEFVEEGHNMHHCVFSNRYYTHPNSLILHALIDGVSVATIEFSLENFTVIQCRGVHNSQPKEYDRIMALIKNNTSQIMSKIA